MNKAMPLLFAALLTACDKPLPPEPPPRPALVVTVGTEAAQAPTVLVGEVRSRFESAHGFRIAGKIVERKVEVGSTVKKGQLLARLDAADTGLTAQAAMAEVHAAEADLALARSELERQRQLHTRKFISAAALDVREAQYKSSDARLQQAKAQAAVAGNQSRYTALTADRDGVVTEIRAEPGQVVEAGEAVARIAVPEALEVEVAIPESRMQGIAIDAPAEIRLWADHEKLHLGKVREVAPAADSATRTFRVRVAISDPGTAIRLGMTAGVRFRHQDSAGFLLPISAVTQKDGQTIVWVVKSGNLTVHPRPVQIGAFREDGVPVTGGLAGGEMVVVAGTHALVPGQVVRPVRANAEQ